VWITNLLWAEDLWGESQDFLPLYVAILVTEFATGVYAHVRHVKANGELE
jgi:hypothetical protein